MSKLLHSASKMVSYIRLGNQKSTLLLSRYFYLFNRYRGLLLLLLCFGTLEKTVAQVCDPATPFFHVDLRNQPAGIFISPSVSRAGQLCCPNSNYKPNEISIAFEVMLDSQAVAINFNV